MADVVDVIVADHVRFETLLRSLRDRSAADLEGHRRRTLTELADLLVAHATAEESEVYPKLRELTGGDGHVEHGEDEHLDGHRRLLALLDVPDMTSPAFDKAVSKLANSLYHHLDEEERTLINDARGLDPATRQALGDAWLAERDRLITLSCGTRTAVAALLPD
ncbi:hemerythrin domain-containing protein [Dactylosporangium sp. NPDC050588]|uniref:hemerythrin domain-containing protein n=1 Tax=Dactylosporangium sp. NPDC050588 TaxID=3157211 RepID=UPI0033CBFFB5